MQYKNSDSAYGSIAIWLHWIMAVIIIALLGLGLYMTSLSASVWKLKLYRWHKEFGIMILMLVSLRIIWRLGNVLPTLVDLPWWEHYAARIVHWIMYALMFAMPLTGWLMSSSADIPVSFFGLFILPNLVSPDRIRMQTFAQLHEWFAWALIAVICLHILAALKHHFVDRDDILRRML